jgi:hypothetical protein
LIELCDDGSDPTCEFNAINETKSKKKGDAGLKQDLMNSRALDEFIEKCKDILKEI